MTPTTLALVVGLVALLLGGWLRRGSVVGVGVGALALAYATGLHLISPGLRVPSAILAGGGLLLAGELGFAGVARGTGGDASVTAASGRRRAARLGAWLLGCGLAGAAVALVVVGAGSIGLSRSIGMTALGAAAAALAVGLVVRAARAAAPPESGGGRR